MVEKRGNGGGKAGVIVSGHFVLDVVATVFFIAGITLRPASDRTVENVPLLLGNLQAVCPRTMRTAVVHIGGEVGAQTNDIALIGRVVTHDVIDLILTEVVVTVI